MVWLLEAFEAEDAVEVADEPLEVSRVPVTSRRSTSQVVEGDYRL